jgi:hypothetical protein
VPLSLSLSRRGTEPQPETGPRWDFRATQGHLPGKPYSYSLAIVLTWVLNVLLLDKSKR